MADPPAGGGVVAYGRRVRIEYTIRLDDGRVADTNVPGEPLTFTQGALDILPALEDALEGRAAGERLHVSFPPEQAFGAYDPELREEIPLSRIPEDRREAGARVTAQDPDGRTREVRIVEIRPATAVLDLNHPAAGETVHFEVLILDVE